MHYPSPGYPPLSPAPNQNLSGTRIRTNSQSLINASRTRLDLAPSRLRPIRPADPGTFTTALNTKNFARESFAEDRAQVIPELAWVKCVRECELRRTVIQPAGRGRDLECDAAGLRIPVVLFAEGLAGGNLVDAAYGGADGPEEDGAVAGVVDFCGTDCGDSAG